MDMSTGLLADVRVREGDESGERDVSDVPRNKRDDPNCSAEPLIETDKYRYAVPTFRPDELRE